jgi:hypothetical protein
MRSGSATTASGNVQRPVRPLTRHLEKNLLAYATAATASLLSVALPAEAEVVYTPSNTPIALDAGSINLDLNGDGVVDFTFTNFFTNNSRGGTYSVFLGVHPAQAGNQIFSFVSNGKVTAAALPDGAKVGSSGQFQSNPKGLNLFGYSNRGGGSDGGDWGEVEYAYVGLKVLISGEVHYGWARVKYDAPGDHVRPTLYGYAYESVANQPIIAGKTSGTAEQRVTRSEAAPKISNVPSASLGLLAAGAAGIEILHTPTPAQP